MSVSGRVTLRDIAARLGVSHVTVSLALKDHHDISKARREEVRAMAKEMGYRPDPALSSLMVYRQGRKHGVITSSLAWIRPRESSEQSGEIRELEACWDGASEAAIQFGYHLSKVDWPEADREERFEKLLHAKNVRGILLPGRSAVDAVRMEGFSAVQLGDSATKSGFHVVRVDMMRAVILGLEKMRECGYRRIGFVVPEDVDFRHAGDLGHGYLAGQKMLGLEDHLPPLTTKTGVFSEDFERGMTEFQTWYGRYRPEAILTASSHTRKFAERLGLKVPADFALAELTAGADRSTAGLEQNFAGVGRAAVETLISLINNNDLGRPSLCRSISVEVFWRDGMSLPPRLK